MKSGRPSTDITLTDASPVNGQHSMPARDGSSQRPASGVDSPLIIKAGVLPFIKQGDSLEDWLFYVARPRHIPEKHKHAGPPLPLQIAKGTRGAFFEGRWRDVDEILEDKKVCRALGIKQTASLKKKLNALTEETFCKALTGIDSSFRLEPIVDTAQREMEEELGISPWHFEGPLYPVGIHSFLANSGMMKHTCMYAVQLQSQYKVGKPDPKITEEGRWIRLRDLDEQFRETQRPIIEDIARLLWDRQQNIPFTDRVIAEQSGTSPTRR